MNLRAVTVIGVVFMSSIASAFEWHADDPKDVKIEMPYDPELDFRDGFKATTRFSVDLGKVDRTSRFANIFCRGNDFNQGYCVMVRYDGHMLIDINGIEPQYYIHNAILESNREYELQLYVTPRFVRIFIDGEEKGSFAYEGSFDYSGNDRPLKLGSMGGYRFFGNLLSLKLESLASVTVPPGGPKPTPKTPPAQQARAEVKWAKPICIEKDRYIGWPSVCRLMNGDLIAVFSGDRDGHVCPWGKVQMIRSTDEGETWSAPVTIANGRLDDRDAGILQMPDGEIIVTYFTSTYWTLKSYLDKHRDWMRHYEKLAPEALRNDVGDFLIRSFDNGKTWSKPEKMDNNYTQTPHGPILLRDGSLLEIGRTHVNGKATIRVSKSTDRGRSWQMLCDAIPDMNGENNGEKHIFCEPHVVERCDGVLVGLVRYHGADNCMRSTFSHDGGRTWTPMAKTPMFGLPPHLIRLPDGKLVSVYGRRFVDPGFGEFACISDDGGKTWDAENEIMLMPASSGDLGYPASALLPNGDIVTVYYQKNGKDKGTCLMATKWRVTK